jgi:multiple sugar transport system ATP-binding protein
VYPATVNCSADSVTFELGDNTSLTYRQSEFSEGVRQQLQQQTSLVVGVRPYAVKRVADGAQATVVANQWLGDQTHISAEFAGTTLVLVEHDQTRLDPGQHIAIAIAAEDLHLFDKDSGNAIAHGGALAS